jgi:hypothetical protein
MLKVTSGRSPTTRTACTRLVGTAIDTPGSGETTENSVTNRGATDASGLVIRLGSASRMSKHLGYGERLRPARRQVVCRPVVHRPVMVMHETIVVAVVG